MAKALVRKDFFQTDRYKKDVISRRQVSMFYLAYCLLYILLFKKCM